MNDTSTDNLNAEMELDPVAMLSWYLENGVDETITDNPTNWFEESNISQAASPASTQNTSAPGQRRPQAQTPLASHKSIVEEAEKIAGGCTTFDELKEALLNFDGCSLKKTASNTVFADGNPDSDIMLIGEAPGADEDRIGKPFVGQAGKLLDKMFAAIDMNRKQDFYVTNVLPWRPPGNRKPTEEECAICLPFLKKHISLFNPKMIIIIGGTSASALLNTPTGITRLRGKWQEYSVANVKAPMMPIFHPAYLLRQPAQKKLAWHDLLTIKEKIQELGI